MKLVRWILGRIILVLDVMTSPTPMVCEATEQKAID